LLRTLLNFCILLANSWAFPFHVIQLKYFIVDSNYVYKNNVLFETQIINNLLQINKKDCKNFVRVKGQKIKT
jgi:hypothetical protein